MALALMMELERRRTYLELNEPQPGAHTIGYDLSERYIAELKKPRIRLGPVIGLLGAAGIGVVLGSTIP